MISKVPFVLSVLILCYSFGALRCCGAKLPQDEVETLRQIALKLGRGDFEFKIEQDPCRVKMVGLKGSVPQENQNNNITCPCNFENNTVCHVVGMYLKGFSLPGVLPPELAKLPHLREIDLTRSYLNGTIPPEWASMKLDYISLTGNRLSGGIPKYLGNITSLKYLSLEANQFSGSLPTELEKLVNIETLILSSNQLIGTLPTTLGKLKSIKDFRVNDNSFHGTIPDFIQNWSELETIHIQGSGLEGPIPSAISRLAKMIDLRISDINGRSAFPVMNNMTRLVNLILRNCNIYGEIPKEIWGMKELIVLDLSFNRLIGGIPSTLSTPRLRQTYLSGNYLSGSVLDSISMNGVNDVDLSYNNFTVQNRCSNNANVNFFRSSSDKNKLGGCKDFSMCSKYWHSFHINCGGDDVLVGSVTYVGDAAIHGRPAETFTSNTNWGFSNTGDFLDDATVGTPFIESAIYPLSMKNSKLYSKARISPISLTYFGFCLENGSYTVKLHFAEILFTNDTTYNSLGGRIFDIYIQGVLIWKDFNIEDEAQGPGKEVIREFLNANVTDGTLEIRFYWAGKGTTVIPRRGKYGPLVSAISVDPNFKPKYRDSDAGKKRTIPIVVGVLASILCIVLFILSILWWKGYFGGKKKREQDLMGMDLQTGSFTLRQIRAATDNFNPANKIGEGGFGSVYMGHLADGTVIAVKQLSSKSRQGNREFVNEIGLISALQHPNLVKLYGCCIEGNQLLLVYEYMENNCLARALNERSQLKLDWATRYNICVGIAKGLAFLHEESPLKIVHRDIKATNVLLDRDLNAKISDFGLAKLDEEGKTHISTRIAGTIGYMAPEYALRGYLTYKADVYSFGIVVLEIVSGKSNSSYKPKDDFICLLEWACVLQQRGSLTDLVDPRLGSEFNKEEAEKLIRVALLCTNTSPSLRPTMSEVISMLEGKIIIQDVLPNSNISSDDMRFKFISDYYHHSHILNFSWDQDDSSSPWKCVGSSALSEHELNQSTSESQDFMQ